MAFIADNFRLMAMGKISAHELEGFLEQELDAMEHALLQPSRSLYKIGEAMPGFGILAAIMGIILFAPAGLFQFQNPTVGGASTAGVTEPIERTMDELRQAPSESAFVDDSMITIRPGFVYVVRSRTTGASFSGCQNYAKVQPLEVNAEAGTVRLRVVGNERCNDRRLVEED